MRAELLAVSLLIVGTPSCAAPPGEQAQAAEESVVGGGLAPELRSVVALSVDGTDAPVCSGVAIEPRLVLTARHCLSQVFGRYLCATDGRSLGTSLVVSDTDPTAIAVAVDDPKVTVARGQRAFLTPATDLCGADLGVLVLDRDLPATVAIASAEPPLGTKVRVSGWGMSATQPIGTRQERLGVPVEAVGPADLSENLGAITANEIALGEGVCFGDSGGAVLDDTGALVAIISRISKGDPNEQSLSLPEQCLDSPGYPARTIATYAGAWPELLDDARAYLRSTEEHTSGCALSPRRADFAAGILAILAVAAAIARRMGARRVAAFPDTITVRPPLAILGVGLGAALASIVAVRALLRTVDPVARRHPYETRTADMMDALPGVLAPEPGAKVLVFGSSVIQFGFSPAELDQAMSARQKPTRSYNLGVIGLQPEAVRTLMERFADEPTVSKADLCVLDLSPGLLTQAVIQRGREMNPLVEASAATAQAIARKVPYDAVTATRIAAYRFLFAGRNPTRLSEASGRWIEEGEPAWWFGQRRPPAEYDEGLASRNDAVGDRFMHWRWNPAARGEHQLAPPELAAAYGQWANGRRSLVRGRAQAQAFDLTELRLDEEAIVAFTDTCAIATRVAKKLLIVISPRSPALLRLQSDRARARLDSLVRRVEAECHTEVIDLMGPEFLADDFVDFLHVTEIGGRSKFTARLTEAVAASLSEG